MKSVNRIRHPALLVLAGIFLASPVVSGRLQPNAYEGGRSRDVLARRERNASSVGVMLGEVRTALSDILMIKTERYMHNGIAYRPQKDKPGLLAASAPLEREALPPPDARHADEAHADHAVEHDHDHAHDHDDGQEHDHAHDHDDGQEHDHDDGHVHDDDCIHFDDEGAETVIPAEEDDFRGFIGRLHREVTPYQHAGLAHQHADGREILPWFRVMTLSDPHHVPGYATGSWWLRQRDPGKALEFADEGIANNPDAYAIYVVKGQILISEARRQSVDIYDPDPATRRILEEAVVTYHEGARAAVRAWREAGPSREQWTKYEFDDAMAAMRMSAMMEQRFGDPDRASALAREYLAEVGEDATLSRVAGLE